MSLADIKTKQEQCLSDIYTSLENQGADIPKKKNLVNVAPTIENIFGSGLDFIDYIESTKTQYIDTGFIPNQNTKVEMEVSFNDVTTQETLWCARDSESKNSFNMFKLGSHFRSDYNISLQTLNDLTLVEGTKYKVCMDKNNVYIDDVLMVTHDTSTFSQSATMLLMMDFTGTHGNGVARPGAFKMYSCKIYDNDTLMRNFRPCIDLYGTYCLYELVERKYYYNQGTGRFRGEKWLPTSIDYIESTGTQWIDTGYKHNENTRILIDYNLTKHVDWKNIFGSMGGTQGTNKIMFFGMNDKKSYYAFFGGGNVALTIPSVGRHLVDFNKNVLTIDDVKHTFTSSEFQSEYNDLIFGTTYYDGSISTTEKVSMKLYLCQIWDNGILVRDYIPVIDENNVACLYDKVSKKIFYNQGPGSFTAGPIVL